VPIRPRTPQRQAKASLLRHWTLWVWFAVALVLCVAGVCLWKSGHWLIHEDKFEKAGWGVVLAGESRDCERSDAAIGMFHAGKLDTLVISACRAFKTRYNSEFMVDYYVQQGVPRDRIFEFRQDAYSTQEEARLLIRQFRLQNLDTVVIVTTSFHTARTRRIFRKLAGGYPVVLVAAAEYNVYDPNAFWSNRESLKLWFDEWMKTLFTAYELAKTDPETDKSQYQGLTPDTGSSYPGEAPPKEAASADSLHSEPEAGADSVAGGNGEAAAAAGDSAKGVAGMSEGKQEALSALDSAVAAKADSIRNRKDSIKAHKDSVKARQAEDKAALAAKDADKKPDAKAESKPAAKEPEAKKTLPKAVKKPEVKKAASSKEAAKASDKKPEKTRPKK
jgi:vancomycin permeability regulator SanA